MYICTYMYIPSIYIYTVPVHVHVYTYMYMHGFLHTYMYSTICEVNCAILGLKWCNGTFFQI